MAKNKDCDCEKCKGCCWHNPGWFGSIEEVEGAAKIMGMSVIDFAKEYLIGEWHTDDEDVLIPAPRRNFMKVTKARGVATSKIKKVLGENNLIDEEKVKNGKGFVKATWGHNLMTGYACVFLNKNQRCTIHKSKPTECRETFGCDRVDGKNMRSEIVKYWKNHQDFIRNIVNS